MGGRKVYVAEAWMFNDYEVGQPIGLPGGPWRVAGKGVDEFGAYLAVEPDDEDDTPPVQGGSMTQPLARP